MYRVFCINLPHYDVPWGSTPTDNFVPLWPGDYLVYVAM